MKWQAHVRKAVIVGKECLDEMVLDHKMEVLDQSTGAAAVVQKAPWTILRMYLQKVRSKIATLCRSRKIARKAAHGGRSNFRFRINCGFHECAFRLQVFHDCHVCQTHFCAQIIVRDSLRYCADLGLEMVLISRTAIRDADISFQP